MPRQAVSGLRPPPLGMRCLRRALPRARFSIAYAGSDNFMGCPIDGYGAPGAWLRPAAVDALVRAEAELAAAGLGVLIFDAYRPVRATDHMWRWAGAVGKRHLFSDGWIARPSRHNRGIAVDLTLVRRDGGVPLDMGSPFDAFVAESHVRGVSGRPLDHRLVLRRAMLGAGFVPLEAEWWHFEHPDPDAPLLDHPYGAGEPLSRSTGPS